jgi:hypothetical protein
MTAARPACEAMLMTEPPCTPASIMCCSTRCITKNMAFTLTANRRSSDASSLSGGGAMSKRAALLTSVWIGPCTTCAASKTAATDGMSVTSAATYITASGCWR